MERSKRNVRILILLVVIAVWVWSRSKESSEPEQRRTVRLGPQPASRYAPERYRPFQTGLDFPALPDINFGVSKVTSSVVSTRAVHSKIQISEIFYHPPGTIGEDAEFVELHHTGDVPLNLGHWKFTKGIDFTFPEDTVLASGDTIIICKDLSCFRKAFGEAPKVMGVYEGGLKNSGDVIRLKDAEGSTHLTVEYSDKAPWPETSDGGGDSLQLIQPAANPADPAQWVALLPTPGIIQSLPREKPTTSIFGVFQHPPEPTSTDRIQVQASAHFADKAVKVELHLDINGTFFVHEIDASDHDPNTLAAGLLTVNLPPLSADTVVRYWFSTEDSQGNRLRFPPLERPTPNEAFWIQGPRVESQLPVYRLMMDQQDLMQMHTSARSNRTYPATFVFDGKVYDQVRVRVRGAFARGWPKKSLKIIFNKDKLFRGESRINLNSGWRDPAFIREHMSYRIYDLAEAFSLETQPVRLQVNGSFWGLFTQIRQPDKHYLEDRGLEGASLYKADSRNNQSDERTFHSEQEYAHHYEKETREEDSYADLIGFCSQLETTDNVADFFEQHVQLERYINFLCAGTLCQNWDGFNKNHFIGFDIDHTKRAFALPWDLDRTLGDYWDWSFDHYKLPLFLGASPQPGVTGWNRMADRAGGRS